MYTDAINQPIRSGDWVVYAKSGYARIAKILDIVPTGRQSWRNLPEYKMTLITAAGKNTYKRSHNFCAWDPTRPGESTSVIRIDRPPAEQEKLIEERIARM